VAQATEPAGGISLEELQLAARNHGMPLEALRHPLTPAGLHYLLVHYDIPVVDAAAWRLEVGGAVERPLSLALDELRARPSVDLVGTMECAGNGRARLEPRPVSQPWLSEAVGTACWTGVPVRALLDETGVRPDAVEVVFTGIDRGVEADVAQQYERSQRLDEPGLDDAVLAYAMNGAPLPPQHGFPLRLVVPGWYGMTNVKWLERITLVDRPFDGFQQATGYRFRRDEDDPGVPVTRMLPRALLAPPGIPDFFSRERALGPGPCLLEGRAWSGYGEIVRVEVSADGGAKWFDATLEDDLGSPWAWRRWTAEWDPLACGRFVLCCRAADTAGHVQPLEPVWNVGGYANNAVQRVVVTVAAG
jgi:DMSO/TMAO reductase YedYZ molybdopterin-dependent catalytic subunit